MSTKNIKVLLYSHDSQGLGHLRRNLALAHHLAHALPQIDGREVTGLLVTGLVPVHGFQLPAGFDWLVLPGIAKDSTGYRPRRLGPDLEQVTTLRSILLDGAMEAFDPDLVIVDRHLHGVRHELRAPLRRLRARRPGVRIVLGLREILDTPEACAREWRRLGPAPKIRSLVDEVWIYGDPTVHNTVSTGEIPWVLHDRCHFTGYLANGRDMGDSVENEAAPFILTTVGGGQDGLDVLEAAVKMAVPAGREHIVVTGPQLNVRDYERLVDMAGPNTRVHRSLPGLGARIARADAVITMGGYNTVVEVLATDTPALVVPREKPRAEQIIRARALEKVGAVDVLRGADLDPQVLARWVNTAVTRRADRSGVARDGLEVVGRRAAALLAHTEAQRLASGRPATGHTEAEHATAGRSAQFGTEETTGGHLALTLAGGTR